MQTLHHDTNTLLHVQFLRESKQRLSLSDVTARVPKVYRRDYGDGPNQDSIQHGTYWRIFHRHSSVWMEIGN